MFFDFTITFGGGPQGTAYLVHRLSTDNEVHVVDAYGCCGMYAEAMNKTGARHHVLKRNARTTSVGHYGAPLARLVSLISQLPELWDVRQRLERTILEVDPDVIWVNNEKSLVFLASILRLRRYPLVVYIRGWATPDQMTSRFKWFIRNRASAVVAHSRATIDQLRLAGIPEKQLHFTPNVVDRAELLRLAAKGFAIPAPTLLRHPRLLLPAARITPKKGHSTALEAVSLLKKDGLEASLWLPGVAAVGDKSDYVDKLKRTAAEAGLTNNVEFLGWRSDMPASSAQPTSSSYPLTPRAFREPFSRP
ncbi:MAG: glycosyltransferase [Elusimicrobiota bacterium]